MNRLLIQHGRVVDPATGTDAPLDILIVEDKIVEVKPSLQSESARRFDASGLVVAPGFIDMHVHLREPGFENKETIASGTRAAARGGFTTVCCMPNTNPANDRPEVTADIVSRARADALVHVLPIAAVTFGLEGSELTDMPALIRAGAVAFSDDGQPVRDSRHMRAALEASRGLATLVIDHCEDKSLSRGGCMHEGFHSRRFGLPGIPSVSEEIPVLRDIALAEACDARVHIAHLSAKEAIRAVKEARERGVRVSAEATPHHLLLTDALLEGRDPDFKMNPPLRSAEDVEALVEAVRSGVVDVIATDHAPHAPEEKSVGIERAPFGIVGLETAVAVLLDRLVRTKVLPLSRFIEMCSSNPARLLGLGTKGRIAAGADADLTLLDLDRKSTVDKRSFESKSRNTPFEGWSLVGAPAATVVGGRIVFPFDSGSASREGAVKQKS